jgi:pimeloyl-ACP methyl ester carboxylesterase
VVGDLPRVELNSSDQPRRNADCTRSTRHGSIKSRRRIYRRLDWPDDVVEVADQLGVGRFAVAGISAGGPYALACTYKYTLRNG